jgi:hypothetical protein
LQSSVWCPVAAKPRKAPNIVEEIAMERAIILAVAFTLTAGMALTAAFGFGLLPLGF